MQAGAFGWAVIEAKGFKKTQKRRGKKKCCVPGLPPVSPACLPPHFAGETRTTRENCSKALLSFIFVYFVTIVVTLSLPDSLNHQFRFRVLSTVESKDYSGKTLQESIE